MAKLMKQTEERHSESRMRAIRTSGSMRGSPRRSLALAPLIPSGSPYSTYFFRLIISVAGDLELRGAG